MNAMLSIKAICAKYDLSAVYVRRAISAGKLKAEKEALPGNDKGYRLVCAESEVIRWRADSGKTRRTDGRARFVLYATPDEKDNLEGLLKESDLGVIITRQNKVKKLG